MKLGPELTSLSLERVQALREKFLTPHPAGLADYWDSEETLRAYDTTLARRIAWKWDAVVDAIEDHPTLRFEPFSRVLDWGCGTGAASMTVTSGARGKLPGKETPLVLHDRSARAMAYARGQLEAAGAEVVTSVSAAANVTDSVDAQTLVLISHVLTELSEAQRAALETLTARAGGVLWVEPGTPFCGGALVQLRERFRALGFEAVLPCPHAATCGLARQGAPSGDWCHFFAEPPPAVFQDGNWMKLARALGIDMRALPVSFLFLLKRDRILDSGFAPSGEALLLGRARSLKGHSELAVCLPDLVEIQDFQHRSDKALVRKLGKPEFLAKVRIFG